MRKIKLTRNALALAAALLAIAVTGSAIAAVTVYTNDFSSRTEAREIINSGGGKRCDRNYREKTKTFRAAVKRSPTTCSYRPPVQGDNELPNHDVKLEGKILKKTTKELRGGAFLELSIRSGGGGVGYALRVFPKKKRFELKRGPGGGGFPVDGRDSAVNGINDRNVLQLTARGAEVRALVNGREVAKVTDDNPGQVSGEKIRFAVGSQKDKRGNVVATFKRIAVAVP